jgi:single-strand DNA-binding protein
MNVTIFSGYLGADPETRTAGETTVTEVRLADTEKWKGKDGQMQERTTWMKVDIWGARGEAVAKYKSKGDWLLIRGKIQVQQWEDKEGNKRYTTFIRAEEADWGPRLENSGSGGGGGSKEGPPPPDSAPSMDDDIPF